MGPAIRHSVRAHLKRRIVEAANTDDLTGAALAALKSPGNALDSKMRWADLTLRAQLDAGGENVPLVPLYAGVEAVMSAANLFDDIEDGDRSPMIDRYGEAASTNIASWILTLGFDLVAEADSLILGPVGDPGLLGRVVRHGLMDSGCGQHLDLTAESPDLERALDIAGRKSGSLAAMVCKLGAVASGAHRGQSELFAELGHHLGTTAQIANDLKDFGSPSKGNTGRQSTIVLTANGNTNDVQAAKLAATALAALHRSEAMRVAIALNAAKLADAMVEWTSANRGSFSSAAA